MGPKDYEFGDQAFSASVSGTIKGYDASGTFVAGASYPFTLAINQLEPEQLFQAEFTDLYSSIDHFTITIPTSYTRDYDLYTNASDFQNNVRLEFYYTEEIAVHSKKIGASSTDRVLEVNSMSDEVTANPVPFGWTLTSDCVNDGFPNYEFQLLRLYNRDEGKTTDEENITDTVDWSRALTYETGNINQTLSLSVVEGTGYYVWRVRPIGNLYPGGIANDRNWGVWTESPLDGDLLDITSTSKTSISDADIKKCIFFYTEFNDDKNWIYSRTFSEGEEGTRVGEKITFATELLQGKQVQAHMQSKDSVLVNQTVYDFNGRPSLASLAAPLAGTGFTYRDTLLKHGTSLYRAVNFDADNNFKNPDNIDKGRVNGYYSNENLDLRIPNSESYAFTRTLYYPDAGSRPWKQGGVGKYHKLVDSSGITERAIRIYYSSPSDNELIAMFGDEAPAAKTVQKIMTVDPNSVPSVKYVSKEGQTIATCLVPIGNTLQDPLEDEATYNPTAVVQKAEKTVGTDKASTTAAFPIETTVTLEYVLTPKTITNECGDFCATCDYILEFSITNMENPSLVVDTASYWIPAGECSEVGEITKTRTVTLPAAAISSHAVCIPITRYLVRLPRATLLGHDMLMTMYEWSAKGL